MTRQIKHKYTPKQKYIWCEATYGCRANDGDTFLISNSDQLPCLSFWDAFSYDGNCVNLKTQLKQVQPVQICLNVAYFQLVFVPVGTAWSPSCCRRLSAERQSWWRRPRPDASSWHHPYSCRPAAGSLCGPNKTSACGLHWRETKFFTSNYYFRKV